MATDIELLARAGAELSTMLEMVYTPTQLLYANPEAASVVTEIAGRLSETRQPLPEEVAHLLGRLKAEA